VINMATMQDNRNPSIAGLDPPGSHWVRVEQVPIPVLRRYRYWNERP
jgi:hypothetical protein